jgi:hypothetical protein
MNQLLQMCNKLFHLHPGNPEEQYIVTQGISLLGPKGIERGEM